jgi:hypothetical protein
MVSSKTKETLRILTRDGVLQNLPQNMNKKTVCLFDNVFILEKSFD